jgi:hypothetical protein
LVQEGVPGFHVTFWSVGVGAVAGPKFQQLCENASGNPPPLLGYPQVAVAVAWMSALEIPRTLANVRAKCFVPSGVCD